MKIQNRELRQKDIMSAVTYVPLHAEGNASHKDCDRGVIITFSESLGTVGVLFCSSRTVQTVEPEYLVWG